VKNNRLILIIILEFFFVSCAKAAPQMDKNVSAKDTIVYSLNGESNTDRIKQFSKNIDNKKADRINIIHYTTEGDPITVQFNYTVKYLEVFTDRSKDKNAGKIKTEYFVIQEDKDIKTEFHKLLGEIVTEYNDN
jgi:hypothetical protein